MFTIARGNVGEERKWWKFDAAVLNNGANNFVSNGTVNDDINCDDRGSIGKNVYAKTRGHDLVALILKNEFLITNDRLIHARKQQQKSRHDKLSRSQKEFMMPLQ